MVRSRSDTPKGSTTPPRRRTPIVSNSEEDVAAGTHGSNDFPAGGEAQGQVGGGGVQQQPPSALSMETLSPSYSAAGSHRGSSPSPPSTGSGSGGGGGGGGGGQEQQKQNDNSAPRSQREEYIQAAIRGSAEGPVVPLPRPTTKTGSSLPTYKVLLIGDAAVGKSNLLSRFASNTFDLNTRSTIGVEFTSREIDVGANNERVNVQLWDTAGQERCGMISSSFFRGARGVAVVYDVTRKQSLLNVPRWVAHAKQYVDESCVFVVIGNKTDLNNLREVEEEEAEEISHILSIRHYYASALTGDGVPSAFLQLILSVHALMKVSGVTTPNVPTGGRRSGAGLVIGGSAPNSASGSPTHHQHNPTHRMDMRGFGGNPQQDVDDSGSSGRRRKCCHT